jgi:hypothetical protein
VVLVEIQWKLLRFEASLQDYWQVMDLLFANVVFLKPALVQSVKVELVGIILFVLTILVLVVKDL